jgi:hypothetical protein
MRNRTIACGAGWARAWDRPIIFLYRVSKIFSFFGLREVDMGVRRQNIRRKGVMGKILGNKELGEVRREVAAFPVDSLDARCTVPVRAFCFLSKGCSSQFRGIFSGAVEKGKRGQRTERSVRHISVGEWGFRKVGNVPSVPRFSEKWGTSRLSLGFSSSVPRFLLSLGFSRLSLGFSRFLVPRFLSLGFPRPWFPPSLGFL